MKLAKKFTVACALATLAPAAAGAQPAPAAKPPALEHLGDWHRTITTPSPEAQRWFDQGLRLMFAFNLEEAQRSFEEAARLDPECASCWWGVGVALGPHVNYAATPERTVAAHAAAQKALALKEKGTPVEQAMIEALARRYSDPAPATPEGQKKLDTDYANAMREVANRFPTDVDVLYFFAEAMMNLRPWDYWMPDGEPYPGTDEILSALDALLARAPQHAGANHLQIHALEASPHPERAVPAADRLAPLMPGAPHMVHMPGHIYHRLGRYQDAAEANRQAIRSDSSYLRTANPRGFYLMYAAHNYQFLWWSCCYMGRNAEATAALEGAIRTMPVEMLRKVPGFDAALAYRAWHLARFGRWEELLEEPAPAVDLRYATGAWHGARGLAFTRLGRMEEAARARDSVKAIAEAVPADAPQGLNTSKVLLGITLDLLEGEMAAKAGRTDEAVKRLTAAARAEDALRYSEPSDWWYPVRHHLGAVLLEAGRAREAQAVYEEDLRRHPENGWALKGLAESLRRQGRRAAAAAAQQRFVKAWSGADVKLAASRM